jgi:hypothetical protein
MYYAYSLNLKKAWAYLIRAVDTGRCCRVLNTRIEVDIWWRKPSWSNPYWYIGQCSGDDSSATTWGRSSLDKAWRDRFAALFGPDISEESSAIAAMPLIFQALEVAQSDAYTAHLARTTPQSTYSRLNLSRYVPRSIPSFNRLEYEALAAERLFRTISVPEDILSDTASEVVESLASYDGNLIAFAKDLPEFGGSLKALLDLGRDFSSPKAWASAWLSGRFGDRLTISDSREILEAAWHSLVNRGKYQVGRSRRQYDRGLMSYTYSQTLIAYNKSYNGLMTAIKGLMDWDAWPTLENMWDMVPLSFVVDWFVSIGDLLSQIDLAVKAPYIRAASQYASLKATYETTIADGNLVIHQHSTHYYRDKAPVLSYIKPFRDLDILPSFSVVNYGDAASLLVQNML